MKFILTDYQEVATGQLLKGLRRATRDFDQDREYTALSLSAPTGAGKTVIATAVIERLFNGDDDLPSDPKATVLWVTDDPSLNEQTSRKMLIASSSLKASQLLTIGPSFDQEIFEPRCVYFLNIQKLAKTSTWVRGGTNARQWSLWATIAQTIRQVGAHFYVIIDEAHRGAKQDKSRPTIVSRIISDTEGLLPPSPVVWGISATPERFQQAMDAAASPSRTHKTVKVDPEDVRESGLLKDKLLIKHPVESQPSDSTLTRLAVDDLRMMHDRWEDYTRSEDEVSVTPILVVQVRANATETDIADTLNTLRDSWAVLDGKAIAHTFESHKPLPARGRTVRYIAPQDIQDDQIVRAVLFKEALTTGWDCPRAEVMLSFRRAADYTYIAQLIGRMVRTPLAKRIVTNDVLNNVSLFLPYYDEKNVDAVIARFKDDPDAPPTEVEKNPVECRKNSSIDAHLFEILAGLPSYVVPGRAHRSQVARLHALAARLAGDGIDVDSISTADKHLIDTIDREKNRLHGEGTLDALVNRLGVIDYQIKSVGVSTTGETETQLATATPDSRNINDLLKAAGRRLRDGVATAYWAHLIEEGSDQDHAKLIVAALAADQTVVDATEDAAEGLVQTWLRTHSTALTSLPEARKVAYYAIRAQAKKSELTTISLPSDITASEDHPRWQRHLYTNGTTFPARFTSWEEEVLQTELDRGVAAWYRNPSSSTRSIRVPYSSGDFEKSLYPDFVFFHETSEGIKPSLVDPHTYSLSDTGPKWRGLAVYAAQHRDIYLRIDAVIKTDDGILLRLDLKDPTIQAALTNANATAQLLQVFNDHGGLY